MEDPAALVRRVQQEEFSLAGLIRWMSFCEISDWQRTKQTSLEFLENHPIGEVNVLRLTTSILMIMCALGERPRACDDGRERSDMDRGRASCREKY